MKVLKFGGSSVAQPDRIRNIYSIIQPRIKAGEKLSIVFSAFGGVTDQLIGMIENASKGNDNYTEFFIECKDRHYVAIKDLMSGDDQSGLLAEIDVLFLKLENILKGVFLLREASDRSYDYVMSFGERLSNLIISRFFTSQGTSSTFLDARKVIVTDSEFRSAAVFMDQTAKNINEYVDQNKETTHIVTGFIAADQQGRTTTLGRGGSDYTAAIFASSLNAEALEIWTDVDGVLTSNPNDVPKAFSIKEMSYEEAMEMSHFGAKVIYPPTIQPVLAKQIPTYIRNTFNPENIGTKIHSNPDVQSTGSIKGLSSLNGVSLMTVSGTGMQGVPGVAARIFNSLAANKINVILITQASSEHSICFSIQSEKSGIAAEILKAEFSKEIEKEMINDIIAEKDISIIAAVGEAMKNQPGIAGKIFSTLGRNGINIEAIAQGSSELNISFAVHTKDEVKALNLIHDTFFRNTVKTLNIFVVGTGLIGGTLIQQLISYRDTLLKENGIEMKVIGLSNSRKMFFAKNGIELNNWKSLLEESEQQADVNAFVDAMVGMNFSNAIFIDNTASSEVPTHYKRILSNNISISTPNKVASSSPYEEYLELKNIAKNKNVKFLFETNVGAGLPVISTIKDLKNSGDKILKIEAVVSGSISYIFNKYKSGISFHDIVKEAQTKGLTEPDPRDDLNGSDVMRKITILTRESGYKINQSDVELSPILPEECMQANSVEDFFQSLKDKDDYFKTMLEKADQDGKRLRFIASMDEGQAKVSLESVDESSPFYNLSESDNMIAFYTKRYNVSPLVIRGPGAGADVTAAGVFAEIIQIANENFYF